MNFSDATPSKRLKQLNQHPQRKTCSGYIVHHAFHSASISQRQSIYAIMYVLWKLSSILLIAYICNYKVWLNMCNQIIISFRSSSQINNIIMHNNHNNMSLYCQILTKRKHSYWLFTLKFDIKTIIYFEQTGTSQIEFQWHYPPPKMNKMRFSIHFPMEYLYETWTDYVSWVYRVIP